MSEQNYDQIYDEGQDSGNTAKAPDGAGPDLPTVSADEDGGDLTDGQQSGDQSQGDDPAAPPAQEPPD
jgi:hypothetical protein